MNVRRSASTSSSLVQRVLPVVASLAVLAALAPPPAALAAAGSDREAPAAAEQYQNITPRDALLAYLDACRKDDYKQAARYLDIDDVSPEVQALGAEALARRLKIILDRTLWVEPDTLSDEPSGHVDDGLPDGVDEVGRIETSSGRSVSVLVARDPDSQVASWRIAGSTIERVPQLYREFGYGALGELLPPAFFELQFLEIELWQWIGLILIVLLAWIVSWIIVAFVYRLLRPVVARTETKVDDRLLRLTAAPMRFAVALALFSVANLALRLKLPVHNALIGLEKGLAVVVLGWLLLRVVDTGAGLLHERFVEEGRSAAIAAVPLGRRTIKVAIIAISLVALLQNLGFNVTGVIAGLGVGGLAIALAAQKTIENFFGGVALISDQPVRVGDFCKFGDKSGSVEDVGIWSTKVRTLERTLITVPNGQFAAQQLENFAARDRIRLFAQLGLRYETSADQLRHVLVGLRRLLASHPRVALEPRRVRFIGFGSFSLDIELHAYVETSDWNEFLAIREDLWLRVMKIVEESGSGFAFPSQTAYFARDSGLDEERARAAEQEVRSWREAGTLPFPDEPSDRVAEIEDSLDWPPEGSPARGAQS